MYLYIMNEYGAPPEPERMCLVVLPMSTFGAIGTPGQTFISELSRQARASVPYSLLPHASWRPGPPLVFVRAR